MSRSKWVPSPKTKKEKDVVLQTINSKVKELKKKRKHYNLHLSQIEDGKEIVTNIIFKEATTAQISISMQAGKTGITVAVFLIFKALVPNLRAYYVCANDQKNYRMQVKRDLEGITDFEFLSLADRRQWESTKDPLLIVFDENHFGDGDYQTICSFLCKNKLFTETKNKLVRNDSFKDLLLCLSATGYSALNFIDYVFVKDLNKLHKSGYNSVTKMLEANKINDCDQFIKHGNVLWESNVLRYLDVCIKKYAGCYGIIRCTSSNANLLERALLKKYGADISIRHWNQHEPLSHDSYFDRKNPTFTVVLIQQMCRMGAVINTTSIKFMAEYITAKTYLATETQSLQGRAQGYGKTKHSIQIFASKKHAQAHSLWELGELEKFKYFCNFHRLLLSKRSKIDYQMNPKNVRVEFRKFPLQVAPDIIKEKLRKEKKKNTFEFPIRAVKTTGPKGIASRRRYDPRNVNDLIGLAKAVGSITAMIYKDNTVKIVERLNNLPDVLSIAPSSDCLFNNISI